MAAKTALQELSAHVSCSGFAAVSTTQNGSCTVTTGTDECRITSVAIAS